MRRPSKNYRLLEELSEQLDEMKAVLKSHDFDIDECEMDEEDCMDLYGEELFRVYQLLKEIEQIVKD